MKNTTYPIQCITEESALAITSFEPGKYSIYYSSRGCDLHADLNVFSGFVFHPFQENTNSKKLYLKSEQQFNTLNIADVKDFLKEIQGNKTKLRELKLHVAAPNEHKIVVQKAIQACQNGYKKVVVSRIDQEEIQKDPLDTFADFCERYPNNGNYIFYSEQSGLWMGSSPETLLELKEEKGTTCALAGTKAQDEEWTDKEKVEQQIVEDYIESIFKSLEINYNSSKSILSLRGINHIKTNYQFDWKKQSSLSDLLEQLHPTPAVAGIPKHQSIDFIQSVEKQNRSYYTGFFGVIQPKFTKLFVNLRCLQVDNNYLYYHLGGGITKDSNPEKEYQETVRKKASIRF